MHNLKLRFHPNLKYFSKLQLTNLVIVNSSNLCKNLVFTRFDSMYFNVQIYKKIKYFLTQIAGVIKI